MGEVVKRRLTRPETLTRGGASETLRCGSVVDADAGIRDNETVAAIIVTGARFRREFARELTFGVDMSSLVIRSRSGPDSKLRLEVPVGAANAEFEVELVVRPTHPSGGGWPPGYFELFGSIADETFVRPPQGELPPPEELR